ncbi:hypothetical protein G647_07106 [Cladophialophora carrionii CBS 160.54]|uniref:Uncharacterized protein n=1 Tax=Cladophialophora carrionii CBS 160.54 TaxID=1279043 RepID=V9D1F1_9EURO|nr:uncharacterized protein G647_07106 [Cladophialophora carrionii CBS 160.54]ETI20764.1 hypothetical protein G647_07106 [Cladophialophora carrionii CBS 160.54]
MPSTKSKTVSPSELNEPEYNPGLAAQYRFNMLSFPGLEKLNENDIKLDAKAMGFKMPEEGVLTAQRFHVTAKDVDSWHKDLASKAHRAIAKGKKDARASYVKWSEHLQKAGYKDVTRNLVRMDTKLDMDIDCPPKPERPYWDHPIEWMESNLRPEVAARELRTWHASEKAWADFRKDMAAFSDPFEDRQCLQDELSTLLQSVCFEGSPVKSPRGGEEPGPEMGGGQLPYPFCEAAFLEEFVSPLFQREEEEEEHGSKATLTLVDRLIRSEDTAMDILALVDAVEEEWRKLVACA